MSQEDLSDIEENGDNLEDRSENEEDPEEDWRWQMMA